MTSHARLSRNRLYSGRVARTPIIQNQEEIPSQVNLPSANTMQHPSSMSDSDILMLQRTIGNQAVVAMLQNTGQSDIQRFPWRRGSRNADPEKLKKVKGLGGTTVPTPTSDPNDALGTVLDDVSETGGFTSDSFGEVGDTLGNFGGSAKTGKFDAVTKDWLRENGLPANTNIDDLSDDQQEALEDKQRDEGGLIGFGSESTRDNLAIASATFGTVGSGLSSIVGFASMVNSIKTAMGEDSKLDKGDAITDAIGQGSQGLLAGGQTLGGISQTISTGIASTGSDAAGTAADASGGVMDMFGSLGGIVELGVSTTKAVLGLIKYFTNIKSMGWGQRQQIVDIVQNFMGSIKSFLSTSKTVISVVSTFLDIAGKSADFLNAVPVAGAAINIAIQLVDTFIQGVEIASQVYQIAKSVIRQIKMKEKIQSGVDAVKQRFLTKLAEVNGKRWKRAIIPLTSALTKVFANIISVGGSILNIVGAATSVAYGAGVGIMAGGYAASATAGVMKLGAASMKPIAAFTRWSKQKIRDKGASGSKIGQKAGSFLHINMSKTSQWKQSEYQQNTQNFLQMMTALPTWDAGDQAVVDQYQDMYEMLKATGVNTKQILGETNPTKQAELIMEALKKRE